jgi:endonuclease III
MLPTMRTIQPRATNAARRPSMKSVFRVCRLLEEEYGRPRFGNPRNAVDDLVYIILSNKTGPTVSRTVYRRLKARFQNWSNVADAPIRSIVAILRPAGLAHVKSTQLRTALRQIITDFGRCSLASLRQQSDEYAALGFEVLPVDAHVHRIASRLGWATHKRADQCHGELESIVPPKCRYLFHVDCLAHGRAVCRPKSPRCHECRIRRFCDYYTQLK